MADPHAPGPREYLESTDGQRVPLYIIRFDKHGRYRDDGSLAPLLSEAPGYSDIYLFSHGWNNEWSDALARYRGFFKGYTGMRRQHGLPMPGDYRPCWWASSGPARRWPSANRARGPVLAGMAQPAGIMGGLPSYLDPRWRIRLLSVAIMKDRAGVVGAQGSA